MAPLTQINPYDSDALLAKGQLYIQEMQGFEASNWRSAFWSALAIEVVARSALSKVSPVLLADASSDWNNIYISLGHAPTSPKFVPKSIAISEVLNRIQAINPSFTPEMRGFCSLHTGHRNAELHSAETPFAGLDAAVWLPSFYSAMEVLAVMLNISLEILFGDETAASAREMITAANDKAAVSVKADISAHNTVWLGKSDAERSTLKTQSEIWSASRLGHVVDCPACQSKALLTGEAMAAPKQTIAHDVITEKQEYLPKVFECVACGLKISGLSRLRACALGSPYINTTQYDAVDHYAAEPDYDYAEYNNE